MRAPQKPLGTGKLCDSSAYDREPGVRYPQCPKQATQTLEARGPSDASASPRKSPPTYPRPSKTQLRSEWRVTRSRPMAESSQVRFGEDGHFTRTQTLRVYRRRDHVHRHRRVPVLLFVDCEGRKLLRSPHLMANRSPKFSKALDRSPGSQHEDCKEGATRAAAGLVSRRSWAFADIGRDFCGSSERSRLGSVGSKTGM